MSLRFPSKRRNSPSAMGLRQILPVQTNRTLFTIQAARARETCNLESNQPKSIWPMLERRDSSIVFLSARQLQPELVPKIKNQNRSKDGDDYPPGMKSAARAWRVEQMRYGPADDRADNPEHDGPHD